MRNLKRFLAMTLTMLMVVGCFSFASFAKTFDDVSEYQTAIDVLSNLDVIRGYEDGTFGPDNAVERWHMALWLAKMETGKISDDDLVTIWRAEENYTDFTDVAVDQYIGAINYAADEAIIIGTTPTTFAPTAGIMYQDALTMVVRALGFGGKAMDAGYPWKYINKAAELGLEEGLSGIAYKDVLTRGQTAQILYNALYVVDSDGNSYISDVFGLTTVVITGTDKYKIINTESVIKKDYVSFNILNADGTINGDVTYHAPATAFGIEAAAADTYVGASFKVTTDDNFKTFGIVIANPSETFEASEIVGAGTPAAPTGATVKLGDDTYEAVTKYSSLYNAQGIKGNDNEILVYSTNSVKTTTDGCFKVDVNYNVLDKDGKIVAYYAPAITGSYVTPYAKKLTNDTYTVFLNNTEIIAAGGVWNNNVLSEYYQTTNTYDLVKNNKYATATAYDDNADGKYDRLFYTYHEFAKISYDAVKLQYNVNGSTPVTVAKFIDNATGETLAAAPADGTYIRYSYNPLSRYLTVYETYQYGTGLVTTVNTATAKIVIGGTAYTYGIATYPGAQDTGVNIGLIGKQVNFILADGIVIEVFNNVMDTKFVVYDNMTGITSQGYGTALVYVQSPAASVITIATVNGYSYQQYTLLASQNSLSNIMPLATGNLYTGTKDALGFWHLTTLEYNYTNKKTPDFNYYGMIDFRNGIGTPRTNDNAPVSIPVTDPVKYLNQFETTANTVFISFTPWDNNVTPENYEYGDGRFVTYQGIPADFSDLRYIDNMYVSLDTTTVPGTSIANFIYLNWGILSSNIRQAAPTVFANDTIVYVNKSATPTVVTDNIGTTGTLLGNTYQYGNVLDMITGKLVTVYVNYNFQIKPGCFYNVYNGYIESEIKQDTVNMNGIVELKTGWLRDYTVYTSAIDSLDADQDADIIENSAKTYIYKLDVNGNVVLDANGALINSAIVAPLAAKNSKAFFYAGNAPHNNVILIDEATQDALKAPTPVAIDGTVHIDGSLFVGETLTADISGITPTAAQAAGQLTYQWMKATVLNGTYSAIAGATAKTYKLLADDLIGYIKVTVTGVPGTTVAAPGFNGSKTSVPVGPINAAAIQTITYDINTGNHGTMAVTTAQTDASVALRINDFTKHGYTFAGWNTAANGSGTNYTDGQIILMPLGGLNLFAQWTADPQTITYNANTGVGTMDPTNTFTDATVTLAANTFTKAGYTFAGWNTMANGNGTSYAAGATVTVPVGGLNLFAQWTADSQTITYNANGGTGTMANTVANTDAIVTLSANTFTRTYSVYHHTYSATFLGWNTAADGSGTSYTDAQVIAMPVDGLTLFAQWNH